MVGHPHRHGAPGLAEVPLQRRLRVADQRERSRPELLDQGARVAGHPDRERVERGRRRDEHRRRHLPAAALGLQQVGHGLGVERVGGDAVDRVGRDHDQRAALDREAGGLDGRLALLLRSPSGSARSWPSPGHRASRAVVKRARPVRSGWSRTSVQRPVAANTAGTDSPWTSACSTPTTPPGPEQLGRPDRQHPDRVQAVGTREQREVRVVVARLGRHRLPGLERDVRRVADDHVDLAEQVVERGGRSRRAAGRRRCRPGSAPPRRTPPGRARPRAPGRPGASSATAFGDRARARCRGRRRPATRARPACSIAQPASSSVSGRGTKTPGPTSSVTCRN